MSYFLGSNSLGPLLSKCTSAGAFFHICSLLFRSNTDKDVSVLEDQPRKKLHSHTFSPFLTLPSHSRFAALTDTEHTSQGVWSPGAGQSSAPAHASAKGTRLDDVRFLFVLTFNGGFGKQNPTSTKE